MAATKSAALVVLSAPTGVDDTPLKAGSVSRLILRLEPLQQQPPAPVIDLDAATRTNGAKSATLTRWSAAAAAAQDGCLVLDPEGRVVSLSARAAELLDCSDGGAIGRPLLDVVTLIDFDSGETDPPYVDRIPPLAVLSGGSAVHSLIRIRHADDARTTLDVCSVALHDVVGVVVGSISFLSLL